MKQSIEISKRKIGSGYPCFIIAEAGVNHNGDINIAKKMVDAAIDSGVDAIKFQTFTADTLVTRNAPKALYQLSTQKDTESQYNMLKKLELSQEAHQILINYCENKDIIFLSSPFDIQSIDFLEHFGVEVFKVPSGELTNLDFLAHLAGKGKPLIVSTGMSQMEEIKSAVNVLNANGNTEYVLLHCVSEYPVCPADVNLKVMTTLQKKFNVPVGYSDHTLGTQVAIAAVAMGACVIEKHFTLDSNMPGPDQGASIEPDQLLRLVKDIRTVELAIGNGRKTLTLGEKNNACIARKSLVAACDIQKGKILTASDISVKRPGTGIPPAKKSCLIGCQVNQNIAVDTLLTWEMIQ